MFTRTTHKTLLLILLLSPILGFSSNLSEGNFSLFLNGADPSCQTCSDGTVTTTLVGGIMPFNYTWSNGATTSNIQDLPNGNYIVTVTDLIGCQAIDSITLAGTGSLTFEAEVLTLGAACFGGNTGNAVAQVTGGMMPYSYAWSTGDTLSTSSNLFSGNYSLTVTDATGDADTVDFFIDQPDSLAVVVEVFVGCGATGGSATATVSGGSFPYSYAWSTNDSTSTANGLSTGVYGVTITDGNGCTAEGSDQLFQSITLQSNPLPNSTSCQGSPDGFIEVDVWGGTAPYSFIWSNGDSTQSSYGLTEGFYSITITDMVGCTSVSQATVEGPAPITLNVQGISNVSCVGGSDGAIFADAFGGNPGYTYVWNTTDTLTFIQNLSAGVYTVTITDATNCTGIGNVTVLEPEPFQTFMFGSSICNGSNDGTATAVVSGGVLPYQYMWSNGDSTSQIENLTEGIYYVTVTDINQCTITDSITVNLSNTILVSNPSSTMITCSGLNNGSAMISPSGGVAPYTYNWSNGATDSIASGLAPGTYTVEVFDLFNCSFTETFNITEPSALSIDATVTNLNCGVAIGSISIIPSGGMPPYSIEWFNGSNSDTISNLGAGTYAVNITDANQCVQQFTIDVTGDNNVPTAITQDIIVSLDNAGQATINVAQIDNGSTDDCGIDTMYIDITQFDCSSLGANTVTLTVVDEENESHTATATVTVTDDIAPSVLTQNATIYLDSLGIASLAANQIDNGSSDNCGIDTMYIDFTQYVCLGVGENTVTLTVIDLGGNMQTDTAIVTVLDTIAPTMSCINDIALSSCDSSAQFIDFPIPQVIDNCPAGVPTLVSGPMPGGEILPGITPVIYEYTDLGGNTITCSFNLIYDVTAGFEIQLDSLTEATAGNVDGSIDISIIGGSGPYTFEWFLNGTSFATTEDLSGVPMGAYEVVVMDANGCVSSFNLDVTTSLNDPELVNKILVYPNPTSDILFVKMDVPVANGNRVQFYTLDGKLLLEKNLNNGEQAVELNLSNFNNGLYLMQLTVNQGVVTKRISVQK